MPKIIVEIEWDYPDEQHWLNADNVAVALHDYCKNTHFIVEPYNNSLHSDLESSAIVDNDDTGIPNIDFIKPNHPVSFQKDETKARP